MEKGHSMSRLQDIVKLLDARSISYTLSHHEPTRTSEDAARIRGVEMHSGAKAIVTKGHKTGTHYLFVLPADLKLDNQKVKSLVLEAVGFERDLEGVTGCVPGSMPPFGSVFGMKTFVDRRLSENDVINFNAGSLTDSVCMKYEDYLLVEKPEIRDITK